MTRPLIRPLLSTGLALLMLGCGGLVVASCGEGEQGPSAAMLALKVDPRKNRKRRGADPADLTKEVTIKLNKPRWNVLEPHFRKLLEQKHAHAKDIFKPQVLNLIPRPELPTDADDLDGGGVEDLTGARDEPKGPLELFPVRDYELMLIMSGTALPKALVVDPRGQAFAVQQDTRIGDRGGMIESISQYSVLIREPNTEQAFVLTIAPPFLDLATRLDGSSGGPQTTPEMLSAPAAGK